MERKPCRAQLQPPDPTQKNRSSARWNGFFCTPHSQSQLPIACNVAGIRVARTNRHAPAPPEIKLHLTKQSQAPTSLPQGGVFGQLIRPIVHAMRSGQRRRPRDFIPSALSTAPSAPLSRQNQCAKQRKAQATCCVVRSKQRRQRI